MLLSRTLILVFLHVFLSCSSTASTFDFSRNQLVVVSNGDKESSVLADYFYNQLNKRNNNSSNFLITRSDEHVSNSDVNVVYFELVEDLAFDYEIKNELGRLSIFAKDKTVFTWLSYMLIDKFSAYHSLQVLDLFPNYISFNSSQVNFAFQYRDVHLQPNTLSDVSNILCLHNVDEDWGIWGHNVGRILSKEKKNNSLALINGVRDQEQYCFSSEETFQTIRDYIIDQHGVANRNSMKFMIAPDDNDKVCQCNSCVKRGNTNVDASPSVTYLLNRLAAEFPNDYFYTIAYRTTKTPPLRPMAANTGVLFSTIDLSKAPIWDDKSISTAQFVKGIKAWEKVTNDILIWDYIANFDEYLVPYPVLLRVQEQLKKFKNIDISGVFLNGSGYDYSVFDDVNTYVLSALMINPHLSVSELVDKFYTRFYPVSGSTIASYLMSLEKYVYTKNLNVPIYSSFRRLNYSYLDKETFYKFHQELKAHLNDLDTDEKERVEKLLIALSYVNLQFAHQDPQLEDAGEYLKISPKIEEHFHLLKEASKLDIVNYKEDKGTIANYLKEWETLLNQEIPQNRVTNISIIQPKDAELLADVKLLNDNLPGFTSDFNQGWFLSGEDLSIKCHFVKSDRQYLDLKMRFLKNKRHRMYPPSKIELVYEGKTVGVLTDSDFANQENYAELQKRIKLNNEDSLEIRIFKDKGEKRSVIACDEIFLF